MHKQAFLEKRAEFRALYFPKQEPVKVLGLRPELRKLRAESKKLLKNYRKKPDGYTHKKFNQDRLELVGKSFEIRNAANYRYIAKYGEK